MSNTKVHYTDLLKSIRDPLCYCFIAIKPTSINHICTLPQAFKKHGNIQYMLLNIRENANLNKVSSADGKVHFALDMKAKHFPNVAYSASYYINALNRLQKTPP